MERPEPLRAIEVPSDFTDVLYLTNQAGIPSEIKRLLRLKKLSCHILPIERFSEVRDRLDLIGTVIIDTNDSVTSQRRLIRIIESLETEHIGVILLTERTRVPVKSFSLSPSSTSFSVGGTIEAVSIDELWTRMSVNLAYRKDSSSMAVKPAIPPRQANTMCKNKLAEQLAMTKVLADNLTEQLRLASLVQQDFFTSQIA